MITSVFCSTPLTSLAPSLPKTMDLLKNKCPICMKQFCCSSHRADHEVKNHSEMYPKLKQDFLVRLFQKRAEAIMLKSQKRQTVTVMKKGGTNLNEKSKSDTFSYHPKPAVKRFHSEMDKRMLSKSVTVSEARRILVPIHRVPANKGSNDDAQLKLSADFQTFGGMQRLSPHNKGEVKTSTPILENLTEEKTSTSNWDYISPASSISYFGTPNMCSGGKSEGQPLLRLRSNKVSITPLRSIMAKNSRYADSDMGPSPNFNSARRVTFSFSGSRISSTNSSSPLESVQEVEIHEEIQDGENDVFEAVSSIQNFSEREIRTNIPDQERYLVEVTSTVNSYVQAGELTDGDIRNLTRFVDDSSDNGKGNGLFSCVTNIFCSAVQTFPMWRTSHNRSKRSRSPDSREVVVQGPLCKRPCYPSDLRLNPIRARKPISQS